MIELEYYSIKAQKRNEFYGSGVQIWDAGENSGRGNTTRFLASSGC